MKALKFIAVILASLTLVLLLFVSLVLIQPQWFKKPLLRILNDSSPLQISLERIDSGWRPISLQLRNVSVRNPAVDDGKPLLNAQSVRLEITDWPSLDTPFFRLALQTPQVLYSLDEEGNSNWPQAKDEQPSDESSPLPFALPGDFAFENILIEDGDIRIALPAQKRHITLPRLQLQRTSNERARLDVQTTIDGEAFELAGEFTLASAHLLALDLALNSDAMQTNIDASLSTRQQMAGSNGKVSFSLQDTSFISRLLGVEIPELPEARVTTGFSIGSHYRLKELTLQLGDQSINGEAVYSPSDNHLTAKLHSERLDLDAIAALFESESLAETSAKTIEEEVTNPPPEPEKTGEAQIEWAGLNTMDLDLDIALKEFSGMQWQAEDIDAKITVRGDKKQPRVALAASTGKIVQQTDDGYALDTATVETELRALDLKTDGADAETKLKLVLNKAIELNAQGRANLNGIEGQDLSFALSAPETRPLWQLAKLPYSEAGALSLEGTVATREKSLQPDITLSLGEQQLTLDATYTDAVRPTLTASVTGKNLDIRFLSPAPNADAKPAADAEQSDTKNAKKKKQPLFSREAIDTSVLRKMDAEVALDIQGLTSHYNTVNEIHLIAQLQNGKLTTRNTRVKLPDNNVKLSFSGNFQETGNTLRTELNFNSSNVGALGLEEAAKIRGGRGNVKLKLSTSGLSPHELASNLNGTIDTRLQELTMDNNKVDLIGSDWVTEAITKLNPFAKSDPVTYLECVAVYFDVKNGVMVSEKNLHVETSKMKIIGDGEVNLGKERMTLNFTPIARKGLGVNLSYLAKLVKIHGNLQSPKLGVDAGGLLSSALSTSAAMATGGASLIAQSLVDRAMNSGSACDPTKKIELAIPEEEAPAGTDPNGSTTGDAPENAAPTSGSAPQP